MNLSKSSLVESGAFLLVFFLTVVLTLYIPETLAVSLANTLSRPLTAVSTYSPDTIQYHLQKSSQDATKTPSCASLYVLTCTLYVYTIYLVTTNRYERIRKRYMDYELLHPL